MSKNFLYFPSAVFVLFLLLFEPFASYSSLLDSVENKIIQLVSKSSKKETYLQSERKTKEAGSDLSENFTSFDQGLHMAVFHPETGRIILKRSFQTDQAYTSWADLLFFLRETVTGHIISLSASGAGLYGLRLAKVFFLDFGSFFTPFLRVNQRWIWTFVKGGKTIYEGIVLKNETIEKEELSYNMDYRNIVLRTSGSVLLKKTANEFWGKGLLEDIAIRAALTKFCHENGAMKQICDLENYLLIKKFKPLSNNEIFLSDLVIIVTAGSRPCYLLYSLSRILLAPRSPKENILIILGSRDTKSIELLSILGLPFVFITGDTFKGNQKLFTFYKNVFTVAARYFPFAKYFTIIDEDVEVSPDYFNYLNQTLVMLEDPSLYCINAHTLVTDWNQVRGVEFLRRGETQMYWGFVVRKDFVTDLISKWPDETEFNYLYDYWIFRVIRENRECLYPDVSRVRHYGLGFNTHLSNQEFEGWMRPFLKNYSEIPVLVNEDLIGNTFENNLLQTLKTAVKLRTTKPWLQNLNYSRYIVFFNMEDSTDIYTWYVLATCYGLHMTNDQGHHKGLFISYSSSNRRSFQSSDPVYSSSDYTFRETSLTRNYDANIYKYKNNNTITHSHTIYFIGVPFSEYSFLYNNSQDFLINFEEFRDSEVSYLINSCQDEINLFINSKYSYKYMMKSIFSTTF